MKQKTEHQKGTVENIYQLNGTVPIVKAIPFGLQHIQIGRASCRERV